MTLAIDHDWGRERGQLRSAVRRDNAGPIDALLAELHASRGGLTTDEARRRLGEVGPNEPARAPRTVGLVQILLLLANPLVIILLIASAALRDRTRREIRGAARRQERNPCRESDDVTGDQLAPSSRCRAVCASAGV